MENHLTDPALGSVPSSELLTQALAEARELIQLEVRMARAEFKEDLARTKRAAIAGAVGAAFIVLALAATLIAVILALGGTVVAAAIVAAVLAGLGAASVLLAYASLPKDLLGHTREHLRRDVAGLKEHVV